MCCYDQAGSKPYRCLARSKKAHWTCNKQVAQTAFGVVLTQAFSNSSVVHHVAIVACVLAPFTLDGITKDGTNGGIKSRGRNQYGIQCSLPLMQEQKRSMSRLACLSSNSYWSFLHYLCLHPCHCPACWWPANMQLSHHATLRHACSSQRLVPLHTLLRLA